MLLDETTGKKNGINYLKFIITKIIKKFIFITLGKKVVICMMLLKKQCSNSSNKLLLLN